MKSTTEQIKKVQMREPKVTNGGMPSRNTPTNPGKAMGTIPAKLDVKATVAKVLKGK